MNISYELRKTLQSKEAQGIVKLLYGKIDGKDEIIVPLPLVTENVTENIVRAHESYKLTGDTPDNLIPNECFDHPDRKIITELGRIGAIRIIENTTEDDAGRWVAIVTIKDQGVIEEIYEWIIDAESIINFSIFSLNMATGVAYCYDKGVHFQQSGGLYKVFKAFLEKPDHELDYKEILSVHGEKGTDKPDPRAANEIIMDLRDKLGMKGKLSGLFSPTGNAYKLLQRDY